MTDAPAPIGHNQPPEPTPFEAMQTHILDLMETAQGFLDGEPIANQETADLVGRLVDEARTAGKDADKKRAAEKKPHDDAAKAVQAKWKPLIDKCDLVAATAKKALAPWLQKLADEQRAAAEAARKAAEEARQAALAAERAARADDLAAAEAVEQARKEAEQAEKLASRAEKAKAHATGGTRAIGLRSYWTAELVDPVAALKHYKAAQPDLLKAWLLEQAQKDANAGKRAIPGFVIHEDRRAA